MGVWRRTRTAALAAGAAAFCAVCGLAADARKSVVPPDHTTRNDTIVETASCLITCGLQDRRGCSGGRRKTSGADASDVPAPWFQVRPENASSRRCWGEDLRGRVRRTPAI